MILHKCDRCGEIFEVPQLEVLVHRLRFKPCFHHPSYALCHKCSCELLKFLDGEKQEEETMTILLGNCILPEN